MSDEVHAYDLVVGVDFGTAYTGVAHALVDEPGRIEVIVEWPGIGRSHERQKVPTEISYQNQLQWGYDIQEDQVRYGWFKLHLDLAAGERAYNDPTLTTTISQISRGDSTVRSLAPRKSASDMATDYLKLVYNHAMKTIKKTKMERHFDSLRIKFVITTPAMWSPTAQDKTRRAAEQAGFGSRPIDTLEMVSEPEAAANYTLKQLDARLQNLAVSANSNLVAAAGWEVGNQIMICDAGGGTVDIVVYEICQITPFLKVRETIPPQGGLCGAVAIDIAFHELLARRLGDQAHLLTGLARSRGSYLMESFDEHKKQFGSSLSTSDNITYRIRHDIEGLQPIPEHNITTSKITLTHADMKSIFDPTVNKVLELVSDLANQARIAAHDKPLLGIILVGGFGNSGYLYDKLNSWAEVQEPRIFIPNPSDGWAAIAKGAVAYGLESLYLDSRRLRCHFGVHLGFPYDPLQHNFADTYVDPWDGRRYCRDTIKWFAKKNDSIEHDQRVEIPFSLTTARGSGTLKLQLVTSEYNVPPKSRKDTRATKLPKLLVDLSKVPRSAFEHRHTEGFLGWFQSDLYKGNFKLEMVVESASLRFEVRTKNDGTLISTHRLGELQADMRTLNITL